MNKLLGIHGILFLSVLLSTQILAAQEIELNGRTVVALHPKEGSQLPAVEIRNKLVERMGEACQLFGKQPLSSYDGIDIPIQKLSAEELVRRLETAGSVTSKTVSIPKELIPECAIDQIRNHDSQADTRSWTEKYLCGWNGTITSQQLLIGLTCIGCTVGLPPFVAAMGAGIGFWSFSEPVLGALLGISIPCTSIGGGSAIVIPCPGQTGCLSEYGSYSCCCCCPSNNQENSHLRANPSLDWTVFSKLICDGNESEPRSSGIEPQLKSAENAGRDSSMSSLSAPSVESKSEYKQLESESNQSRN